MTTIYPGQSVTFGLGGTISSGASFKDDWQPMASAPRDGTAIEVRCTFGVAPWYGLYHWIDTPFGSRWAKVGDENSGFTEDSTFMWRPYGGASKSYVDPTGGAQETSDYWIRAAGLNPRNYPRRPNPASRFDSFGPPRKSLLRRIAEWFDQ